MKPSAVAVGIPNVGVRAAAKGVALTVVDAAPEPREVIALNRIE